MIGVNNINSLFLVVQSILRGESASTAPRRSRASAYRDRLPPPAKVRYTRSEWDDWILTMFRLRNTRLLVLETFWDQESGAGGAALPHSQVGSASLNTIHTVHRVGEQRILIKVICHWGLSHSLRTRVRVNIIHSHQASSKQLFISRCSLFSPEPRLYFNFAPFFIG